MHCPVLLSRRSGFALTTHSSFQGGSGNLPFGIHGLLAPSSFDRTAPWNRGRTHAGAPKATEAPIDIESWFGHPLNEAWQHLPISWWLASVVEDLAWLPLPEEDRQRVVEAAHKVASDAVTQQLSGSPDPEGPPAAPAGFALQPAVYEQPPPHKEADDEIEQARKKRRPCSEPPRAPPEDRLHKSTHLNTSPNNGNRFGA